MRRYAATSATWTMADCAAAQARSKWPHHAARWRFAADASAGGGEVIPPCEKKERDLSSEWMWLSR